MARAKQSRGCSNCVTPQRNRSSIILSNTSSCRCKRRLPGLHMLKAKKMKRSKCCAVPPTRKTFSASTRSRPGALVPRFGNNSEVWLLELGRAREAGQEFQAALKIYPGRFRGLYGAALAAEQTGDKQSAQRFYAKLAVQTSPVRLRPRRAETHSGISEESRERSLTF